jgi:DNA-binding response OmpR family regulator
MCQNVSWEGWIIAMGKHILVVEDDPGIRAIIIQTLTKADFRVTALESGERVTAVMAAGDVDLALVDIQLPDTDGLTLTRQIRENYPAGVIIVSSRSDTIDRIVGLEVGADDYLPKPFEPRELLARVHSVLRRMEAQRQARTEEARPPSFAFNGWKLDCASRTLYQADGAPVALNSSEYQTLEALVMHANRVLNRDRLIDLTSAHDDAPALERSIDLRIGRLRKKLGDDPQDPQMIKTVRSVGYIFAAKVDKID